LVDHKILPVDMLHVLTPSRYGWVYYREHLFDCQRKYKEQQLMSHVIATHQLPLLALYADYAWYGSDILSHFI